LGYVIGTSELHETLPNRYVQMGISMYCLINKRRAKSTIFTLSSVYFRTDVISTTNPSDKTDRTGKAVEHGDTEESTKRSWEDGGGV